MTPGDAARLAEVRERLRGLDAPRVYTSGSWHPHSAVERAHAWCDTCGWEDSRTVVEPFGGSAPLSGAHTSCARHEIRDEAVFLLALLEDTLDELEFMRGRSGKDDH